MSEAIRGKCAVCGKDTIQYFPVDVNDWSPSVIPGMGDEQFLNLGFDYSATQINNAMLSHISFCRHCGYCAADIFKRTDIVLSDVEEPHYRGILYRDGINLYAMHLLAQMLSCDTGDVLSMAYHLIILEWNKYSTRIGISTYTPEQMAVLKDGMYLMPNGMLISLTDIFRCRQNKQMTEALLGALNDRILDDTERKIADFERFLYDSHDPGMYVVSDAISYADECKDGSING